MITKITLENFRGFRTLELDGLQRVNLIVGANNSGKTSLLEALVLLCGKARINGLHSLLRAAQGNAEHRYYRWLLRDGTKTGEGHVGCVAGGTDRVVLLTGGPQTVDVRRAKNKEFEPIHGGQRIFIWTPRNQPGMECRVVPIEHADPVKMVALVGRAQRRAGGEEVLQRLLAAVDARIRKIRVDPGEDGNQVIVDIGLSELIPISQAGQGVYRLVTILADLIGEKPDLVLIDEIENGLHHSVHKQVWAGLAETAASLNAQIFATTHSAECLEAAHAAFSERSEYDLRVIQLFRLESGIQGRVLDRPLIEAAIEGNIDLR